MNPASLQREHWPEHKGPCSGPPPRDLEARRLSAKFVDHFFYWAQEITATLLSSFNHIVKKNNRLVRVPPSRRRFAVCEA